MTEFNLSDKIVSQEGDSLLECENCAYEFGTHEEKKYPSYFKEEDVKEFIKRLKDNFSNKWGMIEGERDFKITEILDDIDKFAGEKLK